MRNMKQNLMAVLVLLSSSTITLAGAVTGVSFSGPGGIGTDGGTFSNVTEPRLTYSAIDYIDLLVTVDSAGSYNVNEAPGLGFITNLTGLHWSAFQIDNITPQFGSLASDWSYYTSTFSAISNSTTQVVASGGAGLDSGSGMAMFGNYITTGPGTFILRETPITTSEPSTALAGGLACIVLSGARLGRSRRRTLADC
jgi:hypothetical protein